LNTLTLGFRRASLFADPPVFKEGGLLYLLSIKKGKDKKMEESKDKAPAAKDPVKQKQLVDMRKLREQMRREMQRDSIRKMAKRPMYIKR